MRNLLATFSQETINHYINYLASWLLLAWVSFSLGAWLAFVIKGLSLLTWLGIGAVQTAMVYAQNVGGLL